MSSKVFVIIKGFDNCEDYEDHYWESKVVGVVQSEKDAKKIVDNLYDEVLSTRIDNGGNRVTTELRKDEDDEIIDVLVESANRYSAINGSYTFHIEEFELGKVKKN